MRIFTVHRKCPQSITGSDKYAHTQSDMGLLGVRHNFSHCCTTPHRGSKGCGGGGGGGGGGAEGGGGRTNLNLLEQ